MQLQFASAVCMFVLAKGGFHKQTPDRAQGSGSVLGPAPLCWPTAGTAEPSGFPGKGACQRFWLLGEENTSLFNFSFSLEI